MSYISVNVRLRPIRFAFLVRPSDAKRALEIFRTNTCLWGGQFNPVIPFFRQTPPWWERDLRSADTASEILNGYLDYFEPDFLVEAETGLADGLGFDDDRVLPLAEILTREGDRDRKGHGMSVFDLYNELYRETYQFSRRHEHDIADITPVDPSFKSLCACIFGDFPQEPDLAYFRRAFEYAFEPIRMQLDGTSLPGVYQAQLQSALRMGRAKIDVDRRDRSNPTLFVLDARRPRDLIDFWNLRATGRDALPIPVQWLSDLSGFCREFIETNYRPLPGNPHGVMINPTVMFGRSIASDDIRPIFDEYFRVDIDGANTLQDWYPSIWRPSPRFTYRQTRPTLTAAEESTDVPCEAEKSVIRFNGLHPEFAAKYGNKHRWANVINLRDWTNRDLVATSFPTDYRNPQYPHFRRPRHHLLPTTEGFVIFPRYMNLPERWEIPDGTTAIVEWLKTQGITATLSDAGRSTQQIVQTLGGFRGVASLAHSGIVNLLNRMSRRIRRSAVHQEFKQKINHATKNDIWRGKEFETLVERKAVELGLELRCAHCSSWSWYSLKRLDRTVNCDLCLRQFDFPVTSPGSRKSSRWAYRLIGPFALPDYAKGGYAVSLSIRFIAKIASGHNDAKVTWSAGQELALAQDDKVECDYILWYQRTELLELNHPTTLVFGEAKSFGGNQTSEKKTRTDTFSADDVERMKRLAHRFPGAILVFSTMKQASELSSSEISRIAKLAKWGREFIKGERQSRAPVVVLTGTELFAAYSLDETWGNLGGRHAELLKPGWVDFDNLRVLADLTQQLYLGMPSYSSWLREKWDRRAAIRQKDV